MQFKVSFDHVLLYDAHLMCYAAGHRNLYYGSDRAVLHRDISVGNTLLCMPTDTQQMQTGSEAEIFGCLIDFDHAKDTTDRCDNMFTTSAFKSSEWPIIQSWLRKRPNIFYENGLKISDTVINDDELLQDLAVRFWDDQQRVLSYIAMILGEQHEKYNYDQDQLSNLNWSELVSNPTSIDPCC